MSEHEIIYACPPTQLNDQAELGLRMIVPDEDAITGNCHLCGIQVWIGPKQQIQIMKKPGPVQCFKCCAAQGVENIHSLGGKGHSYIRKP